MDQDNSKGQDKRNWRERLGIGAQGGKDLPKISDDFRKEPSAPTVRPITTAARPAPKPAAPAVKPAPMAPRANPKPIVAPPVSPDKLAERLRSQREASTKLAEQRVQVAKQRAEAQFTPPSAPVAAPQAATAKPKFTFAEENAAQRPAAPAPIRPAVPLPQAAAPQLSPARPPLGGVQPPPANFTPRAPQPQTPAPQQPMGGYPQAQMGLPPFQPNYSQQPVPPYRPIDPGNGYAPQPGYVPQPPPRGFAPPAMQQPGYAPPPGSGPRLNVPLRPAGALNPNYAPQPNYAPPSPQPGFNAGPRLNPTPSRMQMPAPAPESEYEDELYDDVPTPRATRPSSNDYQQAYREAEYGYEDEAPRSKAPWILAGLVVATMLLVGLGALLYENTIKPMMSGQSSTQEVPAVAAPDVPAKVQAEQPLAEKQDTTVSTPTKKQIYDRIVGDQEVLGGEVAPAAEEPAAIPEPSDAVPQPTGGAGEDATPLPIPPPPGGAGEQQGSLDPASQKQSVETITPAAGESQAAVAAPGDATLPVAEPPAPGELASTTATLATPSVTPDAEIIEDTPPQKIVQKKVQAVEKKKVEALKPKKIAEKPLGPKPVVLVAPSKKPQAKAQQVVEESVDADGIAAEGGLYAGDGVVDAATPDIDAAESAPKKKKTLFGDIFKSKDAEVENAAGQVVDPPVEPVGKKKPVVAETQVASAAGGFVVQLASFRSRAEAQTEYARLKAKHAGTLGRFSPIISEASVGGSTRFRLSVGSMESKAQANAVCTSLFAGGELDCLVRNR